MAVDYERQLGEKSFWSPYFKSMPVVPTSPLWWTDAMFEELQSPRLAKETIKLRNSIKDAYDVFFPHLTETHPTIYAGMNITLESFTWATLQVGRRECIKPSCVHSQSLTAITLAVSAGLGPGFRR